MGLLENKGWEAQAFYNEYLELKTEIPTLIARKEAYERVRLMKNVEETDVLLKEKVERIKFVLNQLKIVHGIAPEDLILLSLGVDI